MFEKIEGKNMKIKEISVELKQAQVSLEMGNKSSQKKKLREVVSKFSLDARHMLRDIIHEVETVHEYTAKDHNTGHSYSYMGGKNSIRLDKDVTIIDD